MYDVHYGSDISLCVAIAVARASSARPVQVLARAGSVVLAVVRVEFLEASGGGLTFLDRLLFLRVSMAD